MLVFRRVTAPRVRHENDLAFGGKLFCRVESDRETLVTYGDFRASLT
jgi:hypothetical protein